jgi:hypothetical protein
VNLKEEPEGRMVRKEEREGRICRKIGKEKFEGRT